MTVHLPCTITPYTGWTACCVYRRTNNYWILLSLNHQILKSDPRLVDTIRTKVLGMFGIMYNNASVLSNFRSGHWLRASSSRVDARLFATGDSILRVLTACPFVKAAAILQYMHISNLRPTREWPVEVSAECVDTCFVLDDRRNCRSGHDRNSRVVIGGRHFWLFVCAGGPPYILYTYLIHHWYSLCIHTTICAFGGPPAMSKSRPPTTMLPTHCVMHDSTNRSQHYGPPYFQWSFFQN